MHFSHLFCAMLLFAPGQSVQASESSETWDCARSALYILLSLDGDCDPEQLRPTLPARPDGISLQELAEASGKLGVALRPVRLSQQDCSRYGTFIAFAEHQGKPFGHFLVVRPIGRTYLQLIDPPQVEMVPTERMFPDPNSFVVALIRKRFDSQQAVGWLLVGAASFLLIGLSVRRLRGLRSVQEEHVSRGES